MKPFAVCRQAVASGVGRGVIPAMFAILVLGCGAGPDANDRRAALEQQRRLLLEQFAAAQNQVRHTQTLAMEDSSLAPLRERFYGVLRERMIEIEPQAEAWLDRARELGGEIDELSGPQILEPEEEPAPREERKEVVEEFAELEATLRPVQDRAMADPRVAAAFQVLQDSVHALMVRINPAAAAALDQMRRTSARVDALDAELRELED